MHIFISTFIKNAFSWAYTFVDNKFGIYPRSFWAPKRMYLCTNDLQFNNKKIINNNITS